MKLNLKVRMKNKLFWVSLVSALFLVIGQTPLVEYVPVWLTEGFVGDIISVFVILGVIVDPTTAGITDSELAMTYEEPKQD